MGLVNTIKDWFRKGGAAVGITKSLNSITDDDRIATNPEEVSRIKLAERYYRGSYIYRRGMPANVVQYHNTEGLPQQHDYYTINMTQNIAKRLASICLNSGFNVSLDSKSNPDADLKQVSQFVDDWLEQSGINRNLESKLEQAIPAGGFAARPYIDNGKIKVAWVRADQFYSLDSNTEEVSQAVIASKSVKVIDRKRYYYTLLEFHQWDNADYVVTNELYKSDDSEQVGQQVMLGTDDMYTGVEASVRFANFKRPLFVYFKSPGQNNLAPESPLGVGFVNNTKNILDAINYTHDSFVWEVQMGRLKVLVPPEMAKPGDEYHTTGRFDQFQDVYQAVAGLSTDGSNPVVPLSPDIRVDEFRQTMDMFLNELENSVGLSSGTFTTDAQGGITTATQVVSENSMTYQTRSSYLNRISKFLTELIQSVLQLAQVPELYDNQQPLFSNIDVSDLQISVHYDDGVFVDKDKQASQDLLVMNAKAMPVKRFLMRNYGLSETDADEWLSEIQDEAPESNYDETGQESDLQNAGDD